MVAGLILGAGLGFGLWLVGRGLTPARRPLAADLAALQVPAAGRLADRGRRRDRSAYAVVRRAGIDFTHLSTDLAICGRSVERHATERLGCATFAAALVIVFWALLAATGAWISPAVLLVLALGAAAAGWAFPALELRGRARARRREFVPSLGVYLDLVAIGLRGGAGVQTALSNAARVAEGWSFDEIRHALNSAQFNQRSPWDELSELARRYDLPELLELTSSLALAGTSGSRVRESLTAKAQSFRAHELAEAERTAQAASERMSAPVVLMLIGLMVLIGYPATQAFLSI